MAGYAVLFETSLETEGELRIGPVSLSTAEMFGADLRRVLMTQVPGSTVRAIRI
jgi:DNA-directed RNA polymerase alpha subunit